VIDNVWPRILKCAEAGALATETKVELELINSAYSILPNDVLTKVIERNLRDVGGLNYTPEELAFAQALRQTFVNEVAEALGSEAKVLRIGEGISYGSTDVGDVSWVVPTAQCLTATAAIGTPFHAWQTVTQGKLPAAHKAMVTAAKVMAATGARAIADPELLSRAKEELHGRRGGLAYQTPLPDGSEPPTGAGR